METYGKRIYFKPLLFKRKGFILTNTTKQYRKENKHLEV